MHVGELALLAFGPRNGAHHFVFFQIVLLQRGCTDFPTIGLFGGRFGHDDHEPVQRIGFEPENARLLIAFAQFERVDRLSRGDIDNFDIFERHIQTIESLFVLG